MITSRSVFIAVFGSLHKLVHCVNSDRNHQCSLEEKKKKKPPSSKPVGGKDVSNYTCDEEGDIGTRVCLCLCLCSKMLFR